VKINTSVREIHAMIDPVTQLVEVLVPITDQVDQLVLGSRVLGRIQLASHNTLAVPRSAVLTDDAGRSSVFVVNNGVARRVPVTSGVEAGDLVAVAGALNAGDTVVTSGNYELVDGMAVREQP
jgi:multidrug efflux pump subunit AcrA (membrane-fusion protein)